MSQVRRRCPFCFGKLGSVGSRENVSIDTSRGVYYCWRCGSAGRLNKWSAKKLDISEYQVHQSDLDEIMAYEDGKPVVIQSKYPEGYVPLYPWTEVKRSIVLRRYANYLLGRGVKPKTMKKFKLGVVLDPPKEQWYMAGNIIYPVLDGDRSGWIRRRVDKQGYFNSKGLARQDAFYNGRVLDTVGRRYVVEGTHDVLAMKNKAVGTLGTSVTDGQLDRLASYSGEVVFAMDGDARRVSKVLARLLTLRGKPASWVQIPSGKDPGKIGHDMVVKLPIQTFA